MAEPGLTPRFPTITLEPVLVTAEPPRTAKLCAVPSDGAAVNAAWEDAIRSGPHVPHAAGSAANEAHPATKMTARRSVRHEV
jgi:hypothetical protein